MRWAEVHSRSLLASIAVSLSTGSAAGSSASVATVATLAETRSNDMEFASTLEKLTRMVGFWDLLRVTENHGLG